jgi:hypothetical protein
MQSLRSPKSAVVGIALLLFSILLGMESSGSAGAVALIIGLVGLLLVLVA